MIWTFFSRNLVPITIICAIAAYLYPIFLIFKDYFLWCFAVTMFALGVVLHPEEAKAALTKPATIIIGVCAQYSIMPLHGFAAAMIAIAQGLSPAIALGFIIVGCAPGTMASNVIRYIALGKILKHSLFHAPQEAMTSSCMKLCANNFTYAESQLS